MSTVGIFALVLNYDTPDACTADLPNQPMGSACLATKMYVWQNWPYQLPAQTGNIVRLFSLAENSFADLRHRRLALRPL